MDPIKTRGYAQATGFNPGTAPNTAEQQRRQDQEFIRQFKEAKELELDQEAKALNRIKENNRLERQNLGEYNRRKEEYQAQQDKIKLNQLKREQTAQQSVAGMNSSDKKFDDALKLVTNLSKTAFNTAGKLQDQYNTSQEELGKADALQYQAYGDQAPNLTGNLEQDQDNSVAASTADLGGKQQEIATQVIDLNQQSQATQIGLMGAPDLEARLKDKSYFYKQGYIKALAGVEGKNFGTTQYNRLLEEQTNNPDKTYVVDGKEQRIADIDISKSENLKKVLQASLPEYIKERGFDKYSSLGLGDFYKNVIASTDQVVGTVRSAEISEQKLDRQDQATSMFQLEPTPINAKLLYTTYNQSGLSNAAARKKMVEQWSTLSEEDFRAMGDMPFGPNDKSFREQYPDEWRDAVTARNSYIESGRQNTKFALESQDQEALLQFQADYLEDVKDGSFDADPATLSQAAEEAEAKGMPNLAKAMRDKIPLTKNAQYDKRFLEGLKSDLELGIANYSAEQIADNPSLSDKAKREALSILQEANKFEVPKSVATEDKAIINSAIRTRAGVNQFTKGPADTSVKVMEKKAWQRYRKVYKQEFERTGNADAASQAALADFQKEFDKKDGLYEVTPAITGANSGKYVNGNIIGKAYSSGIKLEEVNIKVQQNGQAAFTQPDLYTGEKEELTQMLEGINTGKIKIPATLQRIQDNSGGSMSMRQLLNQRLKANGLEEIPQEVGKLADEVEQSFDPRYNKYLNYKPSFVRTDIAMIGSNQDPIYQPNLPADVRNDTAFQAEVSAVAQRLGIREGDLYAVMHFETGGSFSPAEKNMAGSEATGLIQIMPTTAPGLGTTTEALAGMSSVQQMAYVEKILEECWC